MKTQNTTTVLTEIATIESMAIQATLSTLKRIDSTTADPKVREMLLGLREDLQKINNAFYAVSEAKHGYRVSDGYDCYMVAYSYLLEKAMQYGLTADNIGDMFNITEMQTLASGKEKERTIFQWACVEVRKYIYRHGQTDFKRAYIDRQTDKDGNTETEAEALDRQYYQVGRYYDIDSEKDYIVQEKMVALLEGLTERQKLILHYRRQGKSTIKIAEKLGVSQQAISKQLAKIQAVIAEAMPETVRGFKEKRTAKAK